jgi:hypothetical protein
VIVYGTTKFKRKRGQPKAKPKARKQKAEFVDLKPREYMERSYSTASFPSRMVAHMNEHAPVLERPLRYEGEMAEREAVARKEIARKSKMVAPLYNKGGLQYIGDAPPEILQTLGRKI